MIDNFSLLLSHGLILLAMWRLLARPELDNERTQTAPSTTTQAENGEEH